MMNRNMQHVVVQYQSVADYDVPCLFCKYKLHQKGTCINSEGYKSAGCPETYRLNSPVYSELNTDCASRIRYLTAEVCFFPPFQVQPSRIRNRGFFYLTPSWFIFRHNSPFVITSVSSQSMDCETSGLRLHDASLGTVDAGRAVAQTASNQVSGSSGHTQLKRTPYVENM